MSTARVRLLSLDVDGVLTDGSIVYSSSGEELKSFSVRDGFALRLWREAGHRCVIITGRGGEAVRRRAAELGVDRVIEGSKDKASALEQACAELCVPLRDTAHVGDDWPDLPAMRACGLPIAVADAEPEVLDAAGFVTPRPGGRGAVRDAVMHLLARNDQLAEAAHRYGVQRVTIGPR